MSRSSRHRHKRPRLNILKLEHSMHRSHPAISSARALLLPACLALSGAAAITAIPAPASAQVSIDIYAPAPPPPLPDYDQPPLPGDGYIWTPGYWAYGDVGYYWVPGTWVQPPEDGLLWTPGYWGYVNGRYAFNAGYWGPQVGYYGGIDYGFGYTGDGYFGGEWRDGRFAYNRAVNNFGGVHITNVYNRTVVNNVTVNRVSFNGPGGVTRRPTPQQISFAHEHHVPPTPVQVQHRDLAARTPELRNTVNHGHPAITATQRPTAFPKTPAAEKTAPPAERPEASRPGEAPRSTPDRAPDRAAETRAPAPAREERHAPVTPVHRTARPPMAHERPAGEPAMHPVAPMRAPAAPRPMAHPAAPPHAAPHAAPHPDADGHPQR
jgi:hypothetical protein